jgi:hypothetical protein
VRRTSDARLDPAGHSDRRPGPDHRRLHRGRRPISSPDVNDVRGGDDRHTVTFDAGAIDPSDDATAADRDSGGESACQLDDDRRDGDES